MLLHLFASFPHLLIGAIIALLILVNSNDSFKEKLFLVVFTCFVVISPDILKIMGILFGHSLWLAPILGLTFALLYSIKNKNIKITKSWFVFTLVILFGHIFIDYIGNGVRLFYPFVREEFEFSLIMKLNFFIILFLVLSLVFVFFNKKSKSIGIASLSVLLLLFSILTVSKIHLEHSLNEEYKSEGINMVITYPNDNFGWGFQVRTEKTIITGESSINTTNIQVQTKREN
ncbi:hypothetical protein CR203_22685 [Salipaludibacillus neizhouensis]|uniref:Metal-dependent hydrolase n=1 Tax=Salipaludibacillus neizhouensis TaxID=885475 RepID=A0A3A9JX78_9BACI|nr:metal-dependent hydrolase [Salipaludibacillus neizhouensis]RKL65077.1 hypothetical protein CR203_22685 [Salipaludibacillus neizhouensis]